MIQLSSSLKRFATANCVVGYFETRNFAIQGFWGYLRLYEHGVLQSDTFSAGFSGFSSFSAFSGLSCEGCEKLCDKWGWTGTPQLTHDGMHPACTISTL